MSINSVVIENGDLIFRPLCVTIVCLIISLFMTCMQIK